MTNTTSAKTMDDASGFRVAITGTPGAGKSEVVKYAINIDKKYDILTVEELAINNQLIGDVDRLDGAKPIDIESLKTILAKEWKKTSRQIFIDGHLSHLLPVDAIVIIRCNPEILKIRNHSRGWSENKVEENSEWELLGSAWNDCNEWGTIPCLELDSSAQSVEALFSQIEQWIVDGFKPNSQEERIDWVAILHG